MKQRVRKLIEYTWADQLGYAVIGTPNLLEYDQGFFVKGGDGLADVKPIAAPLQDAGLRAGARSSGCPRRSPAAQPTTETFSLPQTQEEFYFGHPYERMDLLVWGASGDVAPASSPRAVGLDADGRRGRVPRDRRAGDARRATCTLRRSSIEPTAAD